MKHIILSALLSFSLLGFGQIPKDYYKQTEGLTGYPLKTKLHEIISDGHTAKGYSALWSFLNENDIDSYYEKDGTILDIYSERPSSTDPYNFTKSTNQCGNYSDEGDCYNREHSFPKSWFGGSVSPMYSDAHHIFATDGKVNSMRNNFPYGNVGNATTTSQNGSQLGAGASTLGYSGTVFEPIDEFKGDVARAHFYMATRYEDKVSGWQNNTTFSDAVLDGSSDKVFEQWTIDLLLSWHKKDPVSQKEIERNNAAYIYQGNRNPFVDHPEFVEHIWGENSNSPTCNYYFPSSTENPTWYEVGFSSTDTTNYSTHNYSILRLISDTTINEKSYSKLISLKSPNEYIGNAEYLGAMRSETCGEIYYIPKNGIEHLMYDFSKNSGDIIYSDYLSDQGIEYFKVIETDSIVVGNLGYRKRMVVQNKTQQATWIEGIGSSKGLLSPLLYENYCATASNDCKSGHMLTCYYQQNDFTYSDWEGDCFYENSSLVNDHSQTTAIEVYPQPANEFFTIYNPQNTKCKFIVYNSLGKEILNFESKELSQNINVESWTEGVYVLKIIDLKKHNLRSLSIVVQ